MYRRNRQCYYRNNNCQSNTNVLSNEMMEDNYQDMYSSCAEDEYVDCCKCGFDEEFNPFPENPALAQSYVPWQIMNNTFVPEVGLKMGTIFPELVSPYSPCQSMREIEYIESTNTIREGCNTCQ